MKKSELKNLIKECITEIFGKDNDKMFNFDLNVDGHILLDTPIYVNDFDHDYSPEERQTMDYPGSPEEFEITNIDMGIDWDEMNRMGYFDSDLDPKDLEASNKLKVMFGKDENNHNNNDVLWDMLSPKDQEKLIDDLIEYLKNYNPY